MDEGDIIFRYTRAMALADGVLIDITELGKEYGFSLPMAINDRLYNHFNEETREQDIGRLLMSFRIRAGYADATNILTETLEGEKVVLYIGDADVPGYPVLTLCYIEDL
jgi:hypothetical protein